MASIEKRSKNTFRLVVEGGYDGQGKRVKHSKTVHVRTKGEAEIELAKFVTEVHAGEYIAPEKMALRDFVEKEWFPKFVEKKLSVTTGIKYKDHINRRIMPLFGHKKIEDIKTMHLVNFFNDLPRMDGKPGQISGSSAADLYKILKSIFARAVEWRVINRNNNPMEGIKPPRVDKKKPKFFESDEAEAAIAALYNEPVGWRLYFLGAMMGGYRRGELTGLEWPHIDFTENVFRISETIAYTVNGQAIVKGTKTDEHERVVVMPEWYMRELRSYYTQWKKEKLQLGDAWEGGDKQYVFHSGGGKPYHYSTPSKRWRKFLKKNNLKHIRLHDLRHTAATLLIEQGASLKAVQERLGHSSSRSTDIYAHVTKKVSKDTAEKLDKFDPKNFVPNSSP